MVNCYYELDGGVLNFWLELGVDMESFKWGAILISDKHLECQQRGAGQELEGAQLRVQYSLSEEYANPFL